jgi:hypothetical protein
MVEKQAAGNAGGKVCDGDHEGVLAEVLLRCKRDRRLLPALAVPKQEIDEVER